MKRWGIKRKLVMLGLLPAGLLALMLGAAFISAQYSDLEKALEERGTIITNQLAQASEYGVFSGNVQFLRALTGNVLIESGVEYIAVFDKAGNSIVSVGNISESLEKNAMVDKAWFTRSKSKKFMVFHAPTYQTQLVVGSTDDELMADEEPEYIRSSVNLGYVTVMLSRQATISRQKELIINGLVMALVMLLVTGLFAIYIGNQISEPIIDLTNVVRELEMGNLNARIKSDASGELKILGDGFNSMSTALQASQQNLQNDIDVATSQLRTAMAALEEKNKELETERTLALQANKAKSQFLANMSHELRTPLNAIIGYSEMLREDAIEKIFDDLVPDLGKINGAGNHLLSLINDVLDLSKIEAGKMELYFEHFDVAPVIYDVSATIKPLLDKNNNKIVVECDNDVGAMHADITKLRQGLLNLISNASKFTRDGQVSVKVSRQQQPQGAMLKFSISDTGIGMTEEQLDTLFQPFTQADASTTRKYGGTGLGLTITRHFCEMMGGSIYVSSEQGNGSTFTMHIPEGIALINSECDKLDVDEERKIEVRRIVKEVSEFERREEVSKVLCIDDDPVVRDLLKRFLASEGFDYTGAQNGKEGMELARSMKPDVITLDIMMPEMDGWKVLNELKNDAELSEIPVVIVSMVNDLRKGYAMGAADFLPKPVNWKRLADTIKRTLRKGEDTTVLLIEDDLDSRNLTRHMLEKEGWKVAEAANGIEGLEQLQQSKPSIILLDLMMPLMDGFEFLEEFNRRSEWQDVPVVILTAADLTQEQITLLQNSVERIIQKNEYDENILCQQVGAFVKSCIS